VPKARQDYAQRAHEAFLESVGEKPKTERGEKNAAAVELGAKGGKARASKLSSEERSKIAKQAAEARWKNR
jgi:hypothetical protein